MNLFFKVLRVFWVISYSSNALAHGEQLPGPHKGYIRMPGAFHTEVVPTAGEREFKVYLLDLSFSAPKTERSKVKAVLLRKDGTTTAATCSATGESFTCRFSDSAKLDRGLLEIKANRLGLEGTPVQYKLPFSFSDAAH